MSPEVITLVIAAGGASSRMGQDKRFLELGGETLLERVMRKGRELPFAARFLSVANQERHSFAEDNRAKSDDLPSTHPLPLTRPSPLGEGGWGIERACPDETDVHGYKVLYDVHPNCGPAESLRCALEAATTEWVLFVSADQPFLDLGVLVQQLGQSVTDVQAVVPAAGRKQYLAALYHRSLLPHLTEAFDKGERRLRVLVPSERTAFVSFPASIQPNVLFFNVNTPADFALARGRVANEARDVPVVTITAPVSNTGKTTFLERILQRLRDDGIRAGVVKGDAHGYQFDPAGKDSARFLAAGADAVAVVSPQGYFIEQKTEERRDLLDVAEKFEDVDLILFESRAHGVFPALTLWRGKGDKTPPDIAVAQFASGMDAQDASIYRYDIDAVDTAVKLVRFLCGFGRFA